MSKALSLEVEPITLGNGGDRSAELSSLGFQLSQQGAQGHPSEVLIILQFTHLSVGVIASKNRLEGCTSIAS